MNHIIKRGALGALALSIASLASAQVSIVSTETFEYTFPGQLFAQNGGVGWLNDWYVGTAPGDISLYDPTVAPPFALDDGVGVYIGQVVPFGEAYRKPDPTGHLDIAAGGLFGLDDTTMWFSYSTVNFSGNPIEHYGGFSLIEQGCCEHLFIGSPWNTNQWGIDDEGPNGPQPVTIAGSDDTVATRIVARIDFLSGMERVRLYINPAVDYPTGPANLDEMIHDFFFDEIKISSGGNNNDLYYFDNIVIAKGDPTTSTGMNYCGPGVTNSTGASGVISAVGSTSVTTNTLVLEASDLPNAAFGFFLTSQAQSFVTNPGGSQGNLCLGGAIGRYVGPGQVQNTGQIGSFTLPLDLTQVPQPTGPVAVLPGETWNFQAWHRDAVGGVATSNFTDGLEIVFTL